MQNNGFIVFYAKDGVIYPVMLDYDKNKAVQMVIHAVLGDNVKVVNAPQSELTFETSGEHRIALIKENKH